MDISKHIVLTTSSEINSICQPLLRNLQIHFFAYVKSFADGSHIRLSNHPQWTQYYYSKNYYYAAASKLITNNSANYLLWYGLERYPMFSEAAEYFNIDNGIILIEKHKNYTELFSFASTRDNYHITNFYLQNLDLLQRFVFYFREKANSLIIKASLHENRLNAVKLIKDFPWYQDNPSHQALQKYQFIQNTPIKKYYGGMPGIPDFKLTTREFGCIPWLLQGETASQIAEHYNLSKRTIEVYLENLKNKLNCFNKKDLISKLKKIYWNA